MSNIKKYIYIIIIMFSFMNNSNGDYEKKFFDFSIKDINNKNLDL